MKPSQPVQLVTIAASAGGIQAMRRLLAALPADFPVPVVLVQHRTQHDPDLLPRVLSRGSRMPVKAARVGEHPAPGVVYVAPSDRHLVLRPDHTFGVTNGRKIHNVRSSADPLFGTAAQVSGGRMLAVVLTGGDSDASGGVQAVKAAGGTVIAQDRATSEHFGMPGSAIRTGAVDYILPLEEIGPTILKLTQESWEGHAAGTLAPTLHAAHEVWLRETDRFLLPVALQEVPFWTRWTAVRYMADQFQAQYRREFALLYELRPLLPEDVAERLTSDGGEIGGLLDELDRVGRRRGAARTVSVLSQTLLDLLRAWCAGIEAAAGWIPRDRLTAGACESLAQMERYSSVHV
jgi:two-component system, chemotaxis family, protein-glutamate methylesterase/glutaminase